jgi:hypothetical protein
MRTYLNWKHLLLLVALSSLAGCSGASTAKEYAYVFYESTGQNQYIVVDSKELPLSFDEARSDKMALGSLRALSDRVLYPNSKGGKIILTGEYDAKTQMFKLEHWYLRVPFSEITLEDRVQMPEEIKEVRRDSLERTDFVKQRDFDPTESGFDPHKYERKESR